MPRLNLVNISRRFGAVQALNDVSLTIRSGEVHALMGENGAGKSTLIRILAGLDRPDSGHLRLDETDLPFGLPAASRLAGLRFIHQELHSVNALSVAENMHLDHPYPTRGGLVNWRALNDAASGAMARLGLSHLDPRGPMSELGAGDQMLVRIAATLIETGGEPAWLYVMDEPTAALTSEETESLFAVIGELVHRGAGVLYVSHRMPEVLRVADRITVLRDGKHVSTEAIAATNETQIIEEMTGRDLTHLFPARSSTSPSKDVVLRVSGLCAGPVKHASFDLRRGEIFGVAGLAGSGRGALLRALIGDIPRSAGRIVLNGKSIGRNPTRLWAEGVAYVPRERRSQGLMIRRAISENVILPHLSRFSRAGVFLDHRRQRKIAKDLAERVKLKAQSVSQPCEELSGGNQQKVLFARAIAGNPQVLLLDEPTRGVDIGARYELYRLIRKFSDEGIVVLIASSDLPELIGLSDRIGIMRDGSLDEVLDGDGLSEAQLLSRFYHLPEEGNVA